MGAEDDIDDDEFFDALDEIAPFQSNESGNNDNEGGLQVEFRKSK